MTDFLKQALDVTGAGLGSPRRGGRSPVTDTWRARRVVAALPRRHTRPAARVAAHLAHATRVLSAHRARGHLCCPKARSTRRLVAALPCRDTRPAARVAAHLAHVARVLPAAHAHGRSRDLNPGLARLRVARLALGHARPAARVATHLSAPARDGPALLHRRIRVGFRLGLGLGRRLRCGCTGVRPWRARRLHGRQGRPFFSRRHRIGRRSVCAVPAGAGRGCDTARPS